jgi:two-component system OmpR family response regulator
MTTNGTHNRVARILLVEDDHHISRIIELALPQLGIPYEYVSVLSAEEGLALWRESSFDLIIADYNLRGMSGLKLIELIKTDRSFIPTMLLTAYDSNDVRHQSRQLEVDAYIAKPFFMDELVDAIRRLLAGTA